MEIKKTLDNMPRFVFWRMDEALLLIIPFSLGVLFGSLLLMLIGFFGAWLYRKIRKQGGRINFKALLYWVCGAGFPNIPSHIRRFRR